MNDYDVYIVSATVDDPGGLNTDPGGTWEKQFATIQKSRDAAVRRFKLHCDQLGVDPHDGTIDAEIFAPDAETMPELVESATEWAQENPGQIGEYPDKR